MNCAVASIVDRRMKRQRISEICTAQRHWIVGPFTFWISLSLRPKTQTERLNFGLSPELRLTNHCSTSLLTS